MPTFFRILIFAIVEILLLPVTLIGQVLFVIVYLFAMRGKQMSLTAYDPMFARWLWDQLGMREDPFTRKLAFALPGMSPITIWLSLGPTMLAMRLSGYYASMYDFPVAQARNFFSAVIGLRTTFYDRVLREHLGDVEQFVVLGAGWELRAFGIAQRMGVRAYEVDTSHTQGVKLDALAKAGIDRQNVRFAAADFNAESFLDALARTDFDPSKRTFVLWEFVATYLQPQAVETTLRTIGDKLAPGSMVAFEVLGKHIIDGDTSWMMRASLRQAKQIGEPWTFGVPMDLPAEPKVRDYVERQGLSLVEFQPFGPRDAQGREYGAFLLAKKG
ncbi:MAG: SAM-dependent methyltransferase [Chloroflexota bacterium]